MSSKGTGSGSGARLVTTSLVILAATQLSIGMIFGSIQTGTSVLATEAGEPGLTGLLHGLLGIGSVIAGLAVVALPDTFGHITRLRVFAALAAELVMTKTMYGDTLVRLRRTASMSFAAEMQWSVLPPLTFACGDVTVAAVSSGRSRPLRIAYEWAATVRALFSRRGC